MRIPNYGKKLLFVSGLFLTNASVVMANAGAEAPEAIDALETAQVTDPAAPVARTFDADGNLVSIESAALQIAPPAGWVVRTNTAGMSMISHEKEITPEVIDYSKPLFKRNITVTTRHEAMPIDQKTLDEMIAGLTGAMEKSTLAKDFQVIEHKFFDYKGKNDGILLYTQLTLGEFPMMQMHVLVSGAEKHYHLTYTDLATEFQANETAFQAAWATMTTMEVEGLAPVRYRDLMVYGGIGGGIFLLLCLMISMRRRSNRRKYASYADSIYDENSGDDGDAITQSGVWVLDDSRSKAASSFSSSASSFC